VSEFWWGLLWLTLVIPLMFLWGFALWDIFSRHDLSGWAKGAWAIGVVLFPLIGMLVYFIARPKEPEGFGGYGYGGYYSSGYGSPYAYPYGSVPQYRPEYDNPAGPRPDMNDMDTINRLHESGTLSDEEYTKLKDRMEPSQTGQQAA
jgi:hypothetical protein